MQARVPLDYVLDMGGFDLERVASEVPYFTLQCFWVWLNTWILTSMITAGTLGVTGHRCPLP